MIKNRTRRTREQLGIVLCLLTTVAAAESPTIAGSSVKGVRPQDSIVEVAHKLGPDCDLRLVPLELEGLPQATVKVRCGSVLTMDVDLDPTSARVYRLVIVGGSAATAEGVRVGDSVKKVVGTYGDPFVHTGEGDVCFSFAGQPTLGFCLADKDRERFWQRYQTTEFTKQPPLEGRIGSIVVMGGPSARESEHQPSEGE
jgi:hypothetical protein